VDSEKRNQTDRLGRADLKRNSERQGYGQIMGVDFIIKKIGDGGEGKEKNNKQNRADMKIRD